MNGSGSVTAVNTFGPSGLLSRTVGTTTTFYSFDPQGNVCQRLNSASAVLSTHGFDAFGTELSTPASTEPWGFGAQAGYYTDRETGLQLLGLRYYDPAQGRFLNRDPSGYQGGINLYNCVHSSPTSLTDPTGLGEEERWYDVSGNAVQGLQGGAKAAVNNFFADPGTGLEGELTATVITSGIDMLAGILRLPQMFGHIGEGTECFWDHPSRHTLPGLLGELGATGASVGIVAAGEGEG